jgi:hypothetical protein
MLYTTRIELRVCTLKLGNPKYKYGIWDEWNDFETQWMWHTPKECLNATYDIKHNEAILQTLNLKKIYMQKTWYELQEVTNIFIAMSTNVPTLP